MRIVLSTIGFVILAFIILPVAILVYSGFRDHKGKADIGVVFGAAVHADGSPAPYLKARLDEALSVYRQGFFPLILVSGGAGYGGRTESVVMADYLEDHGVPVDKIIQDPVSSNTAATAASLKRLMDEQGMTSAFVITQFFHMPRARLALSCAGVETIYSSYARYWKISDLYSILREVPAYIFYWLKC